MVKGEGGVVGLTENFSVFYRWMLFGFEVVSFVNEFDICVVLEINSKFRFYYEVEKGF